MDNVHICKFPKRSNECCSLIAIEANKDIPFEVKRIFYIYGTDNSAIRGQHANRKSEFVLVSVCGSCKVKTDDGHGNQEYFNLDSPTEGLYIPKLVWKDMYDFSPDCVLVCFSSEKYDSNEYIRDFDTFISEMGGK